MTEKEMIEEMAKDLNSFFDETPMELSFRHNSGEIDVIKDEKALKVLDDIIRQAVIPCFAEFLTKQGYRKIHEGAVVIQKETLTRLEDRVAELENGIAQSMLGCEFLPECTIGERNRTVSNVVKEIKAFVYNDDGLMEQINNIAKKYGVDVE
jgi:hypothetical protein